MPKPKFIPKRLPLSPSFERPIATHPREPDREQQNKLPPHSLPPVESDQEVLEQLTLLPAFDKSERLDTVYRTFNDIATDRDFFVPTKRARQLSQRLEQLIRLGFAKRDPLGGNQFRSLQYACRGAQTALWSKSLKLAFSQVRPISGYALAGVSGMGKAARTKALLASYTKESPHESLGLHQVVWLKVECAPPVKPSVEEHDAIDRTLQQTQRSPRARRRAQNPSST